MSELSEVGSDLESRPSNPKACVSCTKYLQMTISMDSQHDPASAFDPSVIVIDNGTGVSDTTDRDIHTFGPCWRPDC